MKRLVIDVLGLDEFDEAAMDAQLSLIHISKIMLTTSAVSFQIADETKYKSFNLYYSRSTVTLAIQGGNGQINRVFGVN